MRAANLVLVLPLLLAPAPSLAEGDARKAQVPAAAQPVARDVVTLKDGRRLEGRIVGEDEHWLSIESGGVTRAYAKDTIVSVERGLKPGARDAAQPAAPGGAATPGEPPKEKRKDAKTERRDQPLSDAARKWLGDLIARTADPDERVRGSAAAAIRELGPQAIPVVREAQAALSDGPQKEFLARLAADMDAMREKRMRGEAPGGPAGVRRALEEMTQRLTAELDLTDEQKPKVAALLEDWGRRRGEVFRDARQSGLSREQVETKIADLRAGLLAKMKGVLTEPQYAALEDMAKRLFGALPPGTKPEGGPPPKPDAPK
jgi:hypothetical protein